MRIKVIACEVFQREIELLADRSEHEFDVLIQAFGLHDTPEELRRATQEAVLTARPEDCDLIVLGYGLCSNGLVGIRAGDVSFVVPRAHDCITLFLGSRERYDREFQEHPGTYYYTCGWIDRKESIEEDGLLRSQQEARRRSRYEEYVAKYGEDNAQFLIEQESLWLTHYDRAAFIHQHIGDVARYREFTQRVAESHGWQYVELEGDDRLLRRMLNGPWVEEDFLTVGAGEVTVACYDGQVIGSRRDGGEGAAATP